jgi:hypothetical protein
MGISKRTLATVFAAGVAALALAVGAIGAAASDGHGDHGKKHAKKHGKRHADLINASLAGSQVGDPVFHGVSPGGAPWVLKRGQVEVQKRGRLDLTVKGLVIPGAPGNGTPGPVTTISASLYCGADSNTTAADTSKSVPISRKGNASIRDRSFNVPGTCLAPVVLVHPNGAATTYIALDGQRP